MWRALIVMSDIGGYLRIICKVLTKFKGLQIMVLQIQSSWSKHGLGCYCPKVVDAMAMVPSYTTFELRY